MKYQGFSYRCPRVQSPPSRGAWIEIADCAGGLRKIAMSPPSRGAWIEMMVLPLFLGMGWSPPTRGAWIENAVPQSGSIQMGVAPHAGGVD